VNVAHSPSLPPVKIGFLVDLGRSDGAFVRGDRRDLHDLLACAFTGLAYFWRLAGGGDAVEQRIP
jgi:hypothetical protein